MSNSIIGYKNVLETGTVTASTEASGFDKESAYDWRPFTFWQPTAVPASLVVDMGSAVDVDYFALASHDLFDNGSTIVLQYSNDNFSGDINDAFTAITPSDNDVIFETFATINERYWRIYVTGGVSSIGVTSFGEQTDLTKGMAIRFAPPTLSRDSKMITSESNKGQFLGRSIERTGYPGMVKLRLLDPAWVRSTWDVFIDHAELKPFFFSWDDGDYSDEAVLAWTNGKIGPATYDTATTMSITLKFNANK